MTCIVRKSLPLLLALALAAGSAAGAFASGEEESAAASMGELSAPGVVPIVEEPVTMTAFVSYTRTILDFETNEMTRWMEEQTNIHWEWNAVNSSEDAKAKFTLLLNSGSELPDMMMGMQISNDEKHLYGSQGLFIPLNDLVAEHGFYINDVLKAAPNFLKESAGPDGNVYVLTAYEECYHCGVAQKMWINQVWLDKLGLAVPTTTEELRTVLRAFKTQDPNGNGVADELALSGFANSWHTRPWPFLLNAFLYTDDGNMLNVQDGAVVAAFVQPEWREGMRYVHSLFAEGLIDEEMFVRDRSALAPLVEGDPPRVGAGTVGHRGMLGAWRGGYSGGSGDFRVVPPLRGPDGHVSAGYFPPGPKTGDSAAITKDADNPAAVYKWIDFMYSREASVRNWWGVFGVDWRWAEPGEIGINGKPAVHTNLGADAVFLEPQQTQAWIHSSPFFMPADLFGGSSGDPEEFNYEGFLIDSSHVYYDHLPDVWVPRMALDVEDAKIVSEIRPVVNSFVYESAAKFVTGRLDINDDNDWNGYLAELDKIGLPRYLEIMNAAYENYK